MSILSLRQKEIIRYLLNEKSYITTQRISEDFEVSEKTIYRDLNIIEKEIKKDNIYLKKVQGKGVKIEIQGKKEMELNFNLKNDLEIIETTSVQDRRADILLELLRTTPNFTSINKLAEKYYISRTSIVNDILYLEKELKKYNLKFEKNKKGTRIIGYEKNIRNMTVNIINSTIHEKSLKKDYIMSKRIEESTFKELETLFSRKDIMNVEKLVSEAEIKLNYTIAESYYINLITHILILIQRLKDGNHVYTNKKTEEMFIEKIPYKIAEEMADKLENLYNLNFPKEEIYFIYQYLVSSGVGSIIQNLNMPMLLNKIDKKVKDIVIELNEKIYNIAGVKMYEGLELYESLILHIKAMLNRLSYNITIKNPLLEDVKKEFSHLFNLVGIVMLSISKQYNLSEINESEISYLTVYFQAILEEKIKVRNIIIVCSSGLGSSYLLKNRIKSVFYDWNIKDIVSLEKLNNGYDLNDVDLIVSTIKISNAGKPVAYVSVLLDEKDIELINKIFLDSNQKEKFEKSEISLLEIANYKICSVKNTTFENLNKEKQIVVNSMVSRKDEKIKTLKFTTNNGVNIELIHNMEIEYIKLGFVYMDNNLNTIIFSINDNKKKLIDLFKLISDICRDKEKQQIILNLIGKKEILKEENIILNLKKNNKKILLEHVAKLLKEKKIINSKEKFLDEINEREMMGSTFIGDKVALPHIISSNVSKTNILILRNNKDIIWNFEEQLKIKVIILVVAVKNDEKQMSLDPLLVSTVLEKTLEKSNRNLLLTGKEKEIFKKFKIL